MKKYSILVLVTFITILSVFANDEKFYSALENCTSYSDGGSTKTDGMDIKFKNNILGWQDNKCVYKENVSYGDMDVCVTCKFSKSQIEELVGVMRAFSTVQKYTGEKIDTSTLDAVKNNPVVNVWNKYLQDSNICKMDVSGND
jgi:hypothetical protein